jgi:Hydrogenase maturation factor
MAIKEPRRSAAGLLFEIFGEKISDHLDLRSIKSFKGTDLYNITQMLKRGVNSPVTSSVGRIFDAIASITGLSQRASFEGQAAMELEWAIGDIESDERYNFTDFQAATSVRDQSSASSMLTIDWEPMVQEIIRDLSLGTSIQMISVKFHNTLVEMIISTAKRISEEKVVLSGGCFQNRYLIERAIKRLNAERFKPYWHQRVPTNDGGISLGQIAVAAKS